MREIWQRGRVVRGLLLAMLSGCQAAERVAPDPGPSPAVTGYAFYLEIDVEHGTVTVRPPRQPGTTANADGPAFSLLGNEIVGVSTANFFRSAVGQYVPNKRTITFDLSLTNRLSVSDLVAPTFPLPPGGASGLLAFPYTVAATGVKGGKAVPNTDWNGDGSAGSGKPANFFNDFTSCGAAVTSDCYRWELFAAPLLPGTSTTAHKVGFTVDPGVTSVGVYLVIAADLLDHPPTPTPGKGAVRGSVTSPQRGPLAGVTVSAAPGGGTVTTDGLGVYQLTGLVAGPVTLSFGTLPAGCSDPGIQSATITDGGVAAVDVSVDCPLPTGTIAGTVRDLDGQPVAGMPVSTPSGSTISGLDGSYTLPGQPLGGTLLSSGGHGCGGVSRFVTVLSGQTTPLDLDLDCPGTVQGVLVPVAGTTLSGLLAVVINPPGGQVSVDPTGAYGPIALPSGPVDVSLFAPMCRVQAPTQVPLTVRQQTAYLVNFTVDCAVPPGTVQVSALAQAGAVRNFTVTAMPGGYTAVGSGPAGLLADLTLPAGHYTLSLSNLPNGCPTLPQPIDVDVSGGANQSIAFTLPSCQQGVQGTVAAFSVSNPRPIPFPLSGVPVQVSGQIYLTDALGFYSALGLIGPTQVDVPTQLSFCSLSSPGLVDLYVLPGEIIVLDFLYTCL